MGMEWMRESRGPGGRVIDRAPGSYAFPLEVGYIDHREFARFVDEEARPLVLALGRNEVLIPESSLLMREVGVGLRMRWEGRTMRVAGVINDHSTLSYEAIVRKPVPEVSDGTLRTVLIEAEASVDRGDIRSAIAKVVPNDHHFRLRSDRGGEFLRYAQGLRPQLFLKRFFGEFSARRLGDGRLTLNGGWTSRNIRSDSVPILGGVTCHRKLFPQLRGALREVKRKGLSHTVRPGEYAGCSSARFTTMHPGIRISRHTFGAALDINVNGNGFGERPHQDPRLVKIMEKWGFLWGGTWMVPDGMHFEFYEKP